MFFFPPVRNVFNIQSVYNYSDNIYAHIINTVVAIFLFTFLPNNFEPSGQFVLSHNNTISGLFLSGSLPVVSSSRCVESMKKVTVFSFAMYETSVTGAMYEHLSVKANRGTARPPL